MARSASPAISASQSVLPAGSSAASPPTSDNASSGPSAGGCALDPRGASTAIGIATSVCSPGSTSSPSSRSRTKALSLAKRMSRGRVAVVRAQRKDQPVQQCHPRSWTQRVGEQGRHLRRLQRRALVGRIRRNEAQHRRGERVPARTVDPREGVDGERMRADVRAFVAIRRRELLIERLGTSLVHRSGARPRTRVELGEERGGMIDLEPGIHEPTDLGRRPRQPGAPATPPSTATRPSRHRRPPSGLRRVALPRTRSLCQPGFELRIGTSHCRGRPMLEDVARRPRRPGDLRHRHRMLCRRRADRPGAREVSAADASTSTFRHPFARSLRRRMPANIPATRSPARRRFPSRPAGSSCL